MEQTDVSGHLDKCTGFHSKPPKCSLLVGTKYPGNMRLALIDGTLR